MRQLKNTKIIAALLSTAVIFACLIGFLPCSTVNADGVNPGIQAFVTSLYSDCLGREPDPSGLNDWCTKLANGTVTGKQCAYGFFFSSEFQAKANQWSDDELINAYYRVFLNRAADAGGKTYWSGQIANTTNDISVLFTGFADSSEFASKCASYGIVVGNHIDVPVTFRGTGSERTLSISSRTVRFDGLEITFAGYYEFVTLQNMFDEHNGDSVIRIPFHIRNTSSSNNHLNPFCVTTFGPSGIEADEESIFFEGDGLWYYSELRPGAEQDLAFYIHYDGNGTYIIDFGYLRTQAEVSMTITN